MAFINAVDTIQKLKQQVAGAVLTPDDGDYEQTRRGWNLSVNHFPALIVVAQNAQDVIAGVNFAREASLGISIQSTGHGIQQPADDALLIVTSRMTAVQVDTEARTARVEAGALWKHVLEQSTPHGLAPLLGTSPHVGVVGYTLGGGIGWLGRRYGLAADHVRWIEVVTADGVRRRASASEHRELFWGLRGGGGNFGVVTALEFDLFPVATLYGGHLIYPGEMARDVLGFYRDWVRTVPDELTSSIAVLKFPALPFIPEPIRGQIQVVVRAAYSGDVAEGAAHIQPWLDWRAPLENTFREMPFAEVGTINNDPVAPGTVNGSNEMFGELSDEALDVITRHALNRKSPLIFAELRHAGGAIARVPADSNAIGNRDAQFYFQLGGPLFPPVTKADSTAYIETFKAGLRPHFLGGVYLNFNAGDQVANRAKDAYTPDSFRRLLALKTQYDPDNRFRYSYQLVANG